MKTIPLNKPFVDRREINAIKRVISAGTLAGGAMGVEDGIKTQICKMLKVKYCILASSCTSALEMALMALDIRMGDEVILPSFNYVSTANAVLRSGAVPVFAEISRDTLNLDAAGVRARLTARTKAIVPVHYAGVPCEMDEIMGIAHQYNLRVIEDAAQAFGSHYKGRFLGTIGDAGCFSFHETKNMTCGEGGVFVTNSREIRDRAEIIHENGTNRQSFLRKEINKYSWVGSGSNYRLAGILAAVMGQQLNKFPLIQKKRRERYEYYMLKLKPLEEKGFITLPRIPAECAPNWHIFYFRVKDADTRTRVLSRLKSMGIGAAFHFIPLHSSPFGRQICPTAGDLPVTDEVSATLIRLPLFPALARKEQDYIIRSVFESMNEAR